VAGTQTQTVHIATSHSCEVCSVKLILNITVHTEGYPCTADDILLEQVNAFIHLECKIS
jgi:hypothetical protein